MAQIQVPESPKEFATQYRELLGVDYQADQTEVDRRRSPDMVNMISDYGGNPVKRDGYRKVGVAYAAIVTIDGVVYGISADETAFTVASLELDGYEFTETVLKTESKNVGKIRAAFSYKRSIYVVAEKCLICYDTAEDTLVLVGIGANMMSTGAVGSTAPVYDKNIPHTIFGLKPDGTGGTTLYDKNLLSIYQMVSYRADGTATYKIPVYTKNSGLFGSALGTIGLWYKVEVKDSNGNWTDVTQTVNPTGVTTAIKMKSLDGTSVETTNVLSAALTFTSAPAAPSQNDPSDNVRITFAPFSQEVVGSDGEEDVYKGFYNEHLVGLLKSSATTLQNNRMFISEDYRVYYSDVSNPFSISDLSWFDVDNKVILFTRSNNSLAVVTEDNGGNTIFLASEETRTVDNTTETYFVVKPSNAGVGGASPKCTAVLSDEPMFLSKTGVYGLLSNYQSEKYAVNRSTRINRRLCKESFLDSAVGIAFNDYLYIAINGRMYVLDGRHKESDRAGNKPLEAYYFEGLPAIENMFIAKDKMYFTDINATYTWNDDLPDTERYFDNAHLKEVTAVQYQIGLIYNEETGGYYEEPTGEWVNVAPVPDENEVVWRKAAYDDSSEEVTLEELAVGDKKLTGNPVRARWCSVYDDDSAPQKLKTLMKKGTMITLVPHYRSGCEITLAKDGDIFEYLGSFDSDLQSFENIDFSRFSFSSNAVVFDNFTKRKIKKYKRLQIQVENNKAEPFGLTQITKTYTYGNYAKR